MGNEGGAISVRPPHLVLVGGDAIKADHARFRVQGHGVAAMNPLACIHAIAFELDFFHG